MSSVLKSAPLILILSKAHHQSFGIGMMSWGLAVIPVKAGERTSPRTLMRGRKPEALQYFEGYFGNFLAIFLDSGSRQEWRYRCGNPQFDKAGEPLNNVIPDSIRNPEGMSIDSGFRRNDGLAAPMVTYSDLPWAIGG